MASNSQIDIAQLTEIAEFDGEGGGMWDHMRREYLAGVTAAHICQRWGVSLSSFRAHARAGGWRRVDQPVSEVPPEFGEYHPDDNVSFADLADQAFLNIRRALGSGRAAEASTWMRVYDGLADRARAEVMADLPDVRTPLLESRREPLKLVASEDTNLNDSKVMGDNPEASSQPLDPVDSVLPGSNLAPRS